MATGWVAWTCLLLATGAPGGADDVVHMNQRGFQIPFSIQPARQAEVKELILWRSADQGRTWGIAARATPDKKGFEVFEREDGLLYFTIAVVDHKGVMDPPDVYRAPVGQKIHMDAVKPAVRVVSAERVGDEVQVSWEAREDRPEWTSFRLEYQAGGGTWTPLPVQPAERGNHRFRPGAAGDVSVRVVLRDLAGNEGTDERLVPGGGLGHHDRAVVGAAGVAPPRGTDAGSPPPPPPPPSGSVPPPPPASAGRTPEAAPAAPAGRGSLPPLQIVNKRQLKLGFDVSRVGPSGVGHVEVYVTTDEGATWARSDADPGVSLPVTADAREGGPMKGTVTVNVPRDGLVYGFYLVVKSRAGLGKPPPKAGDVPHVRVEVDTTEPDAVLRAPQPDPARADSLILVWEATDRNLASNPITLEWSSGPNGPWEFIGESALPNTGRYSWQITNRMPPKVYLKLTVRDTAGNTAVAQTREAVLIDLSRPEVGNVGVVVGR